MGFPLVVRALILGLMFSTYTALSADDPTNATTPKAIYEPAVPTPATEPEKMTDDGAMPEAVTSPMPEAVTPSVPEAVTSPMPEAVTPPVPEAVTFPLPEAEPVAAEPMPVIPPKPPQMALLLPLKSTTFGRAAEAVKDGFMAASQLASEMDLPIEIYDSEENSQNLLSIYNRILGDNTKIVVGPMTRSEVSLIARSGMVTTPTLALNVPDADVPWPQLFYSLSLSQEAEARQLANIAFERGLRRAAIVTIEAALSKRMQGAFAAEWLKLGGTTTLGYVYNPTPKSLAQFRAALKAQQVDVVFIASDAAVARKIRPHIKGTIPTY
ncbi:MAG: penicillin-binding protein activator, partial [Burkholderiales bacterium]